MPGQGLQRLVSSTVLIGVVIGALFFWPLWTFALVVACFITIGLFEFYTMARSRGILVNRLLGVGLGLIFTALVAWRSIVEPGHVTIPLPASGVTFLSWAWDIFWPATIVILFLRQLTRQNTFETLSGLATTLFGLAYIGGLFSYMFYIRTFKDGHGVMLLAYLILVTKLGDVGALVLGRLMGRHTLIPRISPRKTVEGLVAAVLVSGAIGALAQPLVQQLHNSWIMGLCLGLVLGLVGQLGDLAESLIKRDCQVKDSGTLLPGLGGVLDVIDSLLLTTPLFYGFLIYG